MPDIYDFDKTVIYPDSGQTFYKFCLKRHPAILRFLPGQAWAVLRFWLGYKNSATYRGEYFGFMRALPDWREEVRLFWENNASWMLKPWYLAQKKPDDIIISASPVFLLEPICRQLGVRLISTGVHPEKGRVQGFTCRGAEKVRRLREEYGDIEIGNFYSDSLSDTPLAELAKKAWLVTGDKIEPWPWKKDD